jgi:threonine dehydratase
MVCCVGWLLLLTDAMSLTGSAIHLDRVHAEIERVHGVIRPYIRETPVLHTTGSDVGLGAFPLTLKLEFMQHSGSFKARGAFTNLLTRPIPLAGVVAASGGNHGVAVAYAAMRLGVPAKIFVPTVASPAKVERIRASGASVVVIGDRYADALAASRQWAADTSALQIHAFDQVETLLGQGTLGREISMQVPDATTVLVAVGGGGLIGGIASWFANSSVRVVGVEPDGAPTLTEALKAGRPVDAPAGSVAADSLAPQRVGELMFPISQQHIDRVLLVNDQEIVQAQRVLWDVFRVALEPGGATAFAALLAGRYKPASTERVVAVLCGANREL